MFNQINVQYQINAQTKTGRNINRVGNCGLSIVEESLHHVLTNVYFFVLAEFIKQEFGGDSNHRQTILIEALLQHMRTLNLVARLGV